MAEATLLVIFLRALLAGGLSGCMVDVALFPLDSIKTRIQAFKKGEKLTISNPYSGLLSSIVASFPCAATFWATYSTMKWLLTLGGVDLPPALVHLLAAMTSSFTTSLVRGPFEVVKQKMQLGHFKSMGDAVNSIVTKEGYAGFFVGLKSLIMREIPFDVTQFLIYEYLKFSDYGGAELSLLMNLRNGAIAGCCAAYFTTPIDVIKTRLMTGSKDVYKGVWQSLKLVYKTEGLAGLWSGWKIRILYTTVGGMIFFGTFEIMNPILADLI